MQTTSKLVHRYITEDEQFWQKHLFACKASGMNRRAYCQTHEINYARFSYWKKRLTASSNPSENSRHPYAPSPVLLPVQLKSTTQATLQKNAAVLTTLNLKNGHVLQIHDERVLMLVLDRWAL